MKKLFIILLLCAVLPAYSCKKEEMKPAPAAKPLPAPPFTLANLAGKQVSLAEYKGKPLLINIWATWCAPCIAELPELQNVQNARKDAGLTVLEINYKEPRDPVAAFIKKNGYTLEVLLDEKGDVGRDYQMFGLPTSYFVDRAGVIQHTYMGDMTKEIINDGLKKISVEPY
ncbi:MAG: TlpA family protein disulfide reductase [Nitrospinae bacterium]|nr:TlpA family protein disulfide reductase [Nitrospinota bacterium]